VLIEKLGAAEENADCDNMCNSTTPTGNVVLMQNQVELEETQAACFDYCIELSARIGIICKEIGEPPEITYSKLFSYSQ